RRGAPSMWKELCSLHEREPAPGDERGHGEKELVDEIRREERSEERRAAFAQDAAATALVELLHRSADIRAHDEPLRDRLRRVDRAGAREHDDVGMPAHPEASAQLRELRCERRE